MLRIAPPVIEQTRLSPQGLAQPRIVDRKGLNSVSAVVLAFGLSDSYTWPSSRPGIRIIRIDTGACGVFGCSP